MHYCQSRTNDYNLKKLELTPIFRVELICLTVRVELMPTYAIELMHAPPVMDIVPLLPHP